MQSVPITTVSSNIFTITISTITIAIIITIIISDFIFTTLIAVIGIFAAIFESESESSHYLITNTTGKLNFETNMRNYENRDDMPHSYFMHTNADIKKERIMLRGIFKTH
jgi:hypothetical protein